MKIVQVCNHFTPCIGGVERVVFDLSITLAEHGHEVRVVCLDRCANSAQKLPKKEIIWGLVVERVPFIDLKYYKIAPSILWKLRDADIVHVHGIGFLSDYLILNKIFHKKRVVVSTHGGIFHTRDLGIIKQLYFRFVQGLLLNFSDGVVAVSRNDLELFSKISRKIQLVENGVDVSHFSAGKKKANTFLFVGRFSKNKRVEKLLETFAALKSDKFELIIAGVDWENLLGNYEKVSQERGISKNVKFVLNLTSEELKALYSSSEFFVSASRYEGFGLALVEAMASGCISIVERNEGFGNIIADEKQGMFCNYDDVEQACATIRSVIKLSAAKKKAIAMNAMSRATQFSWDGKIELLERIYDGGGK